MTTAIKYSQLIATNIHYYIVTSQISTPKSTTPKQPLTAPASGREF